jgi:Zn finger protein HypA/HybF involved in hydrogenase expression
MHTTDEQRGADMADETYAGEFYCVKCREKREAEGNVVVSNGRRMAKAVCPECGTKLNRILGKA